MGDLFQMWKATLLTIAAVLAGRVLTVYGIVPVSNLFSAKIPIRWQHVMVWGGMRGALALALVLSIQRSFPYRSQLLTLTFGVVAFTIVVQGITMTPLIRWLGIAKASDNNSRRARASGRHRFRHFRTGEHGKQTIDLPSGPPAVAEGT